MQYGLLCGESPSGSLTLNVMADEVAAAVGTGLGVGGGVGVADAGDGVGVAGAGVGIEAVGVAVAGVTVAAAAVLNGIGVRTVGEFEHALASTARAIALVSADQRLR